MTQYRKKPIVIEAVQWWPGANIPGVREIAAVDGEYGPQGQFWTIHGQSTHINPGDWIIQEADGVHWYPCKPDIFAATYEPADTPDPQRAALEAARHELATLGGLWAYDATAPQEPWELDTRKVLAQIDAVLDLLSGHETQEG